MSDIIRPQPGPQTAFLASKADICIYGGSAGSGKAININTLLPTPDGWIRMGDVAQGDVLLDEHGAPCRVLVAHDIYLPDSAYRLTFDDGSVIEACGDHQWVITSFFHCNPATLTTRQWLGIESFNRTIWIDAPYCQRQFFLQSVTQIAPVPMRCITVDSPSHLYLCGESGIPTHNSYALLLECLRFISNPDFGAVIFRRESKEITMEGGLRDTAMSIYPGCGGIYRSQPTPMFKFPSGARVTFAHLNQESEVLAWQGSQIPLIGYDELVHFGKFQFDYMMSRNRSTCGIKPYIRATCNPDADSWVADLIEWWVDQDTGYPIPERSGVVRYFIRNDDQLLWGDSREDLVQAYGCEPGDAKSFTFIPAKITDNPILLKHDPAYLANLKGLSKVEKARLLYGNWKVRAEAGMYFPRSDVDPDHILDWLPNDVVKWVRSWDLAATEAAESRDPDWTVGMLLGRRKDGTIVIGDVIRVRCKASKVEKLVAATAVSDGREVWIVLPQDPGQSGKPIYEEELILMGDGSLRKLKHINVGDRVIGMDGMPHIVTAIHEQGVIPTVKASTNGGRQVIAGLDHPFLTTEGWVEAQELSNNHTVAVLSIPKTASVATRTPEEMRLIGYFIGDGSVGKKHGYISCDAGFTCADDVQLEDFKLCVRSLGGEVVQRSRDVSYGTKGLQQWLRDVQISGATSYTKRIPQWVFNEPPHLIAELVGAYFACDGTISKGGDDVLFYSVSKELLMDVQHLLLRLGISSTLKKKNGKYLETRHVSHMLRIRQQDDGYRRFANRIPVHHTMKLNRLKTLAANSRFRRFDEQYFPDRVVSVEESGMLPCRCITVDESQSFVVNDLVVHNSQVESYRVLLSGFTVLSRTITKNKVAMASSGADSPAALWQRGCISLVRANWNKDLLDELDAFPTRKVHDDQADALSGGCKVLPGNAPSYTSSGLRGRFKEVRQKRY